MSVLECALKTKVLSTLQVLGMPANFTVNPRTGSIDYIQVNPELLSVAAHKQGVVATVGKSDAGDIQIVIPAYLNEEHFQRALPLMPSILRVCSSHSGERKSRKRMRRISNSWGVISRSISA